MQFDIVNTIIIPAVYCQTVPSVCVIILEGLEIFAVSSSIYVLRTCETNFRLE